VRLLLLLLIPPALLLALWLGLRAKGRPLKRHQTNVLSALLLLAYFVATAGLGIFWVARQELPVFDWHYVFGYVTAALMIFHVAYNWRVVASTLSKWSPAPLVEGTGNRFRPMVRGAAWVFGAGLALSLAFLIGYQTGVEQVRLELILPAARDDKAPAPLEAGPLGGYVVEVDGRREGVALHYHRRSAFDRVAPWDGSTGFEWENPPASVHKAYPEATFVPLPDPQEATLGPFTAAQTSRAAWSQPPSDLLALDPQDSLELDDVGRLLFATDGLTAPDWGGRAAPSAGALYPTVTYLIARRVEGLTPGLYHYAVDRHGLHLVREGATAADLAGLVEGGSLVEDAPLSIVFTVIFHRSGWKYGARSYRYAGLDTGHRAGSLTLAAAALDRSAALLSRFDDTALSALLGVDGQEEAPLLVVPVGRAVPTDESVAPAPEPVFRPVTDLDPALLRKLLPLTHRGTSLELAGAALAPSTPEPALPAWAHGREDAGQALSAPLATNTDLLDAIRRRRSRRSFTAPPLEAEVFSGLLADTASAPHILGDRSLSLYLVVNRVEGLAPGSYLYRAQDHTLLPVLEGDHARAMGAAALDQDAIRGAHAVAVFVTDFPRMQAADGQRGYRGVNLAAGVLGMDLYLSATARGLGACGVGAYYDDEVAELLGLDLERQGVLYLVALGRPDE
jgi:SagB-type dehydrogenase family enzyme